MNTEFHCPKHGMRGPGGYDERHRCTSCGQALRAVPGGTVRVPVGYIEIAARLAELHGKSLGAPDDMAEILRGFLPTEDSFKSKLADYVYFGQRRPINPYLIMARKNGIKEKTFYTRVNRGMDELDAATKPARTRRDASDPLSASGR